ncbi:TetR/AcrR family transcriptional regulator [Stackebrandtia nassauensis]|uniref:Transcriptional regulator, TetR family n=1 Tax=Stackebrandtia nassauensis (strain DSM 44728 / CIP 108903 / NRRL B-16338 / NBRC 102104 / LLR-40K-21) TaxID=446470 RepID=D3PUC7_STANL|nr:TetR/AcrR family transcriptional regulator [Stackebrandtia nassauensis]ADD42940.1 transcriptional regulator, TetR family [Stackebrandtia nassauensis DSM 44728]
MTDSPKSTATRAGLTPERIVDAAMALTEGEGLHTWSLRDLAKKLDVAPSVIYHHIGGKDELSRCVVERVITAFDRPDPELDWPDWFRALLYPARAKLRAYPGVAMWLMMHGPAFEHLIPIIDDGIAALERAGFAERTGLAYTAILNSAMLTVAAADERKVHADDGSRDHAAIMRDFERVGADSPGVGVLKEVITSFTDTAEETGEHYYRFVIDTVLAGLEQQLPG